MTAMGGDAQDRFAEAKEYYKAWKLKARREAVFRTPSSQAIAWRTLRLVGPLLPPQVQTAISIARTCVQAFQVVSAAIDALSPPAAPVSPKNLQPQLAIR